MFKRILFTVHLVFVCAAAHADGIDPLLGTWVSPDGYAKQSFVRTFDGSLIKTTMWFMTETGWKQVSAGVVYQRPGENQWRSVARTRDMDDIRLFETIIRAAGSNKFLIENVAYQSDGTAIISEEEWAFASADSFDYLIFKVENGKREKWMKGSWVLIEESD